MQRRGSKPKCEPNRHVSHRVQICSNGDCQTTICENCWSEMPGKADRYCQMCYISIINMQGGGSSDEEEDGGMSFGSRGSSAAASGGFSKIGVKKDTETGEITGWEDFYAMARSDNPQLEQEEHKHTAVFN